MGFDIASMLGTPSIGGVQANTVMAVELEKLAPYRNHKFRLYEGERLDDMAQSIKANGVLNPIIVQPLGEKFKILAGHNRRNAARIEGLTAVRCIVKNGLTDDEAEVYVIETNLMQRGIGDLSVSERAAVVAYRYSKMFSEEKAAAIRSELQNIENSCCEAENENAVYAKRNGKNKLIAVGAEYELSKTSVTRLLRISKLTEDLQRSIDLEEISVRAGVELSYISEAAQKAVYEFYKETVIKNGREYEAARVDMNSAPAVRKLFEDFDGDAETAAKMLESYSKGIADKPVKPKKRKLNAEVYVKYFDEDDTDEYVNGIIDNALQMYFEREKAEIA
ncbi:MAG: ParB N-terminal domain-containing protein [Prevotella sp.]|nr:ParB N-terminal domain-containing protein [Prevotella sp.]